MLGDSEGGFQLLTLYPKTSNRLVRHHNIVKIFITGFMWSKELAVFNVFVCYIYSFICFSLKIITYFWLNWIKGLYIPCFNFVTSLRMMITQHSPESTGSGSSGALIVHTVVSLCLPKHMHIRHKCFSWTCWIEPSNRCSIYELITNVTKCQQQSSSQWGQALAELRSAVRLQVWKHRCRC